MTVPRERFASRLGIIATMIGAAVGLGNVWRFPYMVGRYGGIAFVMVYLLLAVTIAIPALMAEWSLGRETRKGTVGAFEVAGLPGGRWAGWLFFITMIGASGYYSNAIGWVGYHMVAELLTPFGRPLDGSHILPPEEGLDLRSFGLQIAASWTIIIAASLVLLKGLRRGIEHISRWITPILFLGLIVLIVRSVTLPGAGAGIREFLHFDPTSLSGAVVVAALGQVVFSVGLGGIFMIVYGSYLDDGEPLGRLAVATLAGDTQAGVMAGLAIFPAVFAFGLEAGSGPGLIFSTLPQVFAQIPLGWIFGATFFGALLGVAFLSAIAGLEVVITGLTDNTRLDRRTATWTTALVVMAVAIPPMINLRIFVPWDLTFGSGAQTLGALTAVVTLGWALSRSAALAQIAGPDPSTFHRLLFAWIRYVIPAAMIAVGLWWLLTDVLGAVQGV
jgi:NSS family neurotransmitter:Na+ symporter